MSTVVTKIYVGPSLPHAILRQSQILRGTEEEINTFIESISESYPEVKYLLTTPEELPNVLLRVGTKGNILHKYYQDMAAKASVSRKGF